MHAEKLRRDAYRLTDSKLSSHKRKRAAEHTPLPALNLQKLQQAPFLKRNLTISKHLGRGVTGDPVSWTLPYTPGCPASCGRERLTIIIIAPISPLSLSLWCLSWPFSSSLLLFLLLFNHSLLAGPAPGFSLQRSFCLTPDLAGTCARLSLRSAIGSVAERARFHRYPCQVKTAPDSIPRPKRICVLASNFLRRKQPAPAYIAESVQTTSSQTIRVSTHTHLRANPSCRTTLPPSLPRTPEPPPRNIFFKAGPGTTPLALVYRSTSPSPPTMSLLHFLMAVSLLTAGGVNAASTVSLSDFVPRIESLPSLCLTAYNQVLKGCVAEDFDASKQRCSADCVQGLVEISQQINNVCSLNDVSETSIIGVFLLGQGIPILCQGVSVTTIGADSSTTSTSKTSSAAVATSTPVEQSSSATSRGSVAPSSTLATSTANAASSTSSTSSTITEAASTSLAAAQPSFIWSLPTAQPSQTASSQKSNADSGGGSPFDVVATGSSSQSQIQRLGVSLMGAILGSAVLLCVAM
jgi:hypothetical protein